MIVVGVVLLFSLPTLAFFGAVGQILRTAPAPAPISLDVQMDVRRDGVVEVEETATIDYGPDPDVGFFRGFDPRYVTDDGLVLIRRLRFVEAFERMAGGRRRSMPGDLVDEPKLSHYWSFGNDSTKAAGRRTFVLRYEIYGGLRQRAGAVEMPWDLAGLQASGFLRSVSATIEAPGLIDVACAECVNDSVRGDVGRVLARNHSSSTVLDVTATLEAGSVADPRPDLIPTAGRRRSNSSLPRRAGAPVIGITYNSKGEEQRMSVLGKVNGSGGFGRGARSISVRSSRASRAPSRAGDRSSQLGARGELQATLDLAGEANRENRLATRRFLDGRDPITGAPADRLASAQDLFRRFEDEASVNVRAYATGETTTGFRAKATVVGAEASLESKEATLIGAWYRARDGGFRQWTGCRR